MVKTCGCPDGYPLFEDKVKHTGRCPFNDETLAAYQKRLAAGHKHRPITVCKTCGVELKAMPT